METLFEQLRAAADPYIVASEIARREMIEDQKLVGTIQQNVLKFYMSVFAAPAVGLSEVTVNRNKELLDIEKQRIVELFRHS